MSLRDGDPVSEDTALIRFSAGGLLSESTELSKVLRACGDEVRSGLPKEEQTGRRPGEDRAK